MTAAFSPYRLMAGKHTRYELEDIEEFTKTNAERQRRGLQPLSPPEKTYIPGDVITPQSEGEALLMKQDPGKFMPLSSEQNNRIDELIAENNRLKQLLADKEQAGAAEA